MSEVWLSVDGVTAIENRAKRTIRRRIANGYYQTVRHVPSKNGGGKNGTAPEIALSCLSDAAKAKYYQSHSAGRMAHGEEENSALPTESTRRNHLIPTGGIVCPGLAGWQNRIAAARFDLVSDYIKVKEETRKKKKRRERGSAGPKYSVCAAGEDFVGAYNTGLTHPQVFKVLGKVTKKTIERWVLALKRSKWDFAALAPRYGDHVRGKRKVTEAEMEAMLRFALDPNRHRVTKVVHWAKNVLAKADLPSPSSKATLRRALLDWKGQNYDIWVSRREGEKALDDKVLPYLERDSSQLSVGDVLVADGHPLNFQVINPFTGNPGRAVWLVFYDWASRYPAGQYIMFKENIQCIHAALRRGVLNLGKIPKAVLLDNGKAFRAKVFNDKSLDFEQAGFRGLYARLGIKTYFAAPYNAKAKPVERFFGTFNELERLLPSYIGASVKDQPAHMKRNEKLAKRLHNPFVPTIEQANTIIQAWVDEEYATRAHRGINGARPIDIWEPGKGKGVDEEGLRYLMMTHEIKRVHRNGVTMFGLNYYNEALYGYRKPVLIKYDILNMEKILVCTEDDTKLICEAQPMQKVHPMARLTGNPLDLEAVKQQLQRKRRLKKSTEADARQAAGQITWDVPGMPKQVPDTPLTRAEIEHIESQAAETKVVSIADKREPEMALWEGDAYEGFIEKRARGEELSEDELIMMNAFEQTSQYKMLQEYYQGVEERTLMQEEGL